MKKEIKKQTELEAIIKWTGGKESELKHITPLLPKNIKKYFEPFIGGGSVWASIIAEKYFINDKSDELISLYKSIAGTNGFSRENFFTSMEKVISNWDLLTDKAGKNQELFIDTYKKFSTNNITEDEMKKFVNEFIKKNSNKFLKMFSDEMNYNPNFFLKELRINMIRKIKRMKVLEKKNYILPNDEICGNIETALKSAFYMQMRHLFNNVEELNIKPIVQVVTFFFIRNFTYSAMFRYNSDGKFNVPYGGMGYNRKNIQKKINYLKSEVLKNHLDKTKIENFDFEKFLKKYTLTKEDFIFLDPPYDSEFSTYSQNEFNKDDQIRLANYLIKDCKANWMMVIKNTPLMQELYIDKGLEVMAFNKIYLVSFMNRNDKKVEHLLIKNY